MRFGYLLLILLIFAGCKHARKVNTSFYYWKTVYRQNKTEADYLQHLHAQKLYVRIMDVDLDDNGLSPVPVSPVVFQTGLPDTLQLVPVVYIVNDVLKHIAQAKLNDLARKIILFVNAKTQQAGKQNFNELQIDCDWTAETRANYFYLLKQIRPLLKQQSLSVTLRLHQLKNQNTSGIPPAGKVLLMCYNMGNLRKYGMQNSILELSELKKYLNNNLNVYPMPIDIALPLFSWAVAFRNKEYIGIDKRINFNVLNNQDQFSSNRPNLYVAKTDLPAFGLQKGDEVRWESASTNDLQAAAGYIASYLKTGTVNIVWFHLDEAVVKKYTYEDLQNTADLLH